MKKKKIIEPNGKDILSTEQLSARWGGEVMPETLVNWRGEGRGPKYVKLGGKSNNRRVVYRLAAVEEYERANERTPKVSS